MVKKSLNERIRKYFFKRYIQRGRYAQAVEIGAKHKTGLNLGVQTQFSTPPF
jgi:hypothetical protein